MVAWFQRRKWWLIAGMFVFLGLLVLILDRWRDSREHSQDPVILAASLRYNVHPALIKAVVWR